MNIEHPILDVIRGFALRDSLNRYIVPWCAYRIRERTRLAITDFLEWGLGEYFREGRDVSLRST